MTTLLTTMPSMSTLVMETSETYQEAAVMSENHSESDKQVHHATMLHHDDLADDDALDVHLGDGDIRDTSGSHRDVRESF